MYGKLMIRLFGQLRNKASKSHFGLRRAEKGYIDMFFINVPYIEYTTIRIHNGYREFNQVYV